MRRSDGGFQAVVSGYVQFDSRGYRARSAEQKGFAFRRVRSGVDGKVCRNLEFKAQADFSDLKRVSLRDAYVKFRARDELQLWFGQLKEPWGQEQLHGDSALEFVERSMVNNLTPGRGEAQEIFETPESVTIATGEELSRRAFLILPQALREETGVHLQQTTTSQGSLFIRGLSGQQVVNLIDGVRFNDSTMRPGANQYLAFIDPAFAGRVEVVRGANSSQYGSDSLGGTVNVLTRPVGEMTNEFKLNGSLSTYFGSADLSAGGGLNLSGGRENWGFTAGMTGRRVGDLRTGGGIDSHSVVTRLFGLSSKTLGDRLQNTGYRQYGANAKFVYRASAKDALSLNYLRGTQRGVSRYDQLDGGAGILLNKFDPQTLDFFTARYQRLGLGFLDSLSATFSFNGQRDDRTWQSINNAQQGLRSKITDEYNRANAFGYRMQAATHIGGRSSVVFGGELYDEFIASRRTEASFNAATGDYTNVAGVRARYPNAARYRTLGLFAQTIVNLIPQKLIGSFGARYSHFGYSQSPDKNPLGTTGQPTVPLIKLRLGDITYNSGLVYALNEHLNLTGNFSRGFRAPNVNDLASIGISVLGFEISNEEGVRLGERSKITLIVENVFDKNYRPMGSGIDAPGFNAVVRYALEF